MAYDTTLEARIDEIIAEWPLDVVKRKMFGGLGYFIDGTMAFGVKDDAMIVKASAETINALLQEDGLDYFRHGPRVMKSWLLAEARILDEDNLVRFLGISRDFAMQGGNAI